MTPSPQDILHHFIASRREFDQDRHKGTPGYLRASEFGPCEREQHFKRLGIERTRDFDEKTLLTFEWGNLLEAVVREAYRACGLLVASQVSLKDDELKTTATTDLVIGGRISTAIDVFDMSDLEALFHLLEQNTTEAVAAVWLRFVRESLIEKYGPVHPYKVLEVKSQKDSAMVWAYKQGPSDGYKLQVGVQQLLAERNPDQMPVPVQSFGIVYVGKGNWGILDWDAEPSWEREALTRIYRLNAHQDLGSLPPCTCASVWGGKYRWNPNTKQSYCAYFEDGNCCSESLVEKVGVVA